MMETTKVKMYQGLKQEKAKRLERLKNELKDKRKQVEQLESERTSALTEDNDVVAKEKSTALKDAKSDIEILNAKIKSHNAFKQEEIETAGFAAIEEFKDLHNEYKVTVATEEDALNAIKQQYIDQVKNIKSVSDKYMKEKQQYNNIFQELNRPDKQTFSMNHIEAGKYDIKKADIV